ncbi:MAG: aminotransferase class V-fold PLP-dependent enzyme [Gemmatimonadales bacterium]|nr:aminotransferase class V-fold PLP-dependent enzyme [Gemmatimonadales bacterium]
MSAFVDLRAAEFGQLGQVAYLDAASIGILPERSRRALVEMADLRARPWYAKDRLFAIFAESRRLAARLIGASPAEIALTGNTSIGLNTAARMLPLGPGDIVLVSEREFPANVYPWLRLAQQGVVTEMVPLTSRGWPDEDRMVERLRDPRVRCLAVSAVQFASGYRADLVRLSAATRASGAFLVVDAIQALGQLPIDVGEVEIDLLATGGQKWLLSPWGTGFLYVRRALVERLLPPYAGWLAFEGTDDFNRLTDYGTEWHHDARRFELITLPFQDFAAMNRSLQLLLEVGPAAVQRHLRRVYEPLEAMAERRGLERASPEGAAGSGVLCLRVPGAERALHALRDEGVICSLREGALRFSAHLYNTPDDTARASEVLERQLT